MGQFLWLMIFGTIMNYLISSAILGDELTMKRFLPVQGIVVAFAIYYGFFV